MNCHVQVIAADGEQKAARALKVKITQLSQIFLQKMTQLSQKDKK